MLKTAFSIRLNLKKDTVLCFIGFVKAFDRVEFSLLFKALQNRGVHNREISLLSEIYTRQKAYMKGDSEKTQDKVAYCPQFFLTPMWMKHSKN